MNRSPRLISFLFLLVITVLVIVFTRNGFYLYNYEKDRIGDEVDMLVKETSQKVLHQNVTQINHIAAMLTDRDFDEKMAFAAGFTQNMASIGIFFDDDTVEKKTKRVVPVINKEFLTARNISYSGNDGKTIQDFDSLFKHNLDSLHLNLAYSILPFIRQDTAAPPDSMVSRTFIIDAIHPRIYRVVYEVPQRIIYGRMVPNIASGLLAILLVAGGFIFYRRSYNLQLQSAQFKESMFSNITHELKTPVSSLQLILEAAFGRADSTGAKISAEHLLFANRELSRMKLNIDKILSFSKLNSREFELDKELVNLDETIEDAIAVMEMSLTQKNATLLYDQREKINVLGDKVLLVSTITTLIDNAVKYNNGAATIEIALYMEQDNAVIEIKDNGIGIAVWHQKKIFEPFFRVPTGNRHDVKGHGLGLSFAKQVVALHKGEISVASEGHGEGSTFTITIPLA